MPSSVVKGGDGPTNTTKDSMSLGSAESKCLSCFFIHRGRHKKLTLEKKKTPFAFLVSHSF